MHGQPLASTFGQIRLPSLSIFTLRCRCSCNQTDAFWLVALPDRFLEAHNDGHRATEQRNAFDG